MGEWESVQMGGNSGFRIRKIGKMETREWGLVICDLSACIVIF